MKKTENKLLRWIKKNSLVIAEGAVCVGIAAFLGVKTKRLSQVIKELETKNKDLAGKNRELTGENKALQVENHQVRKENANLNYQLGKAVSHGK